MLRDPRDEEMILDYLGNYKHLYKKEAEGELTQKKQNQYDY